MSVTPSLERMIEDLEEKKWFLVEIRPMFTPYSKEFEDYEIGFTCETGAVKQDGKDLILGRSSFLTKQTTFKDCVTEAWKILTGAKP